MSSTPQRKALARDSVASPSLAMLAEATELSRHPPRRSKRAVLNELNSVNDIDSQPPGNDLSSHSTASTTTMTTSTNGTTTNSSHRQRTMSSHSTTSTQGHSSKNGSKAFVDGSSARFSTAVGSVKSPSNHLTGKYNCINTIIMHVLQGRRWRLFIVFGPYVVCFYPLPSDSSLSSFFFFEKKTKKKKSSI